MKTFIFKNELTNNEVLVKADNIKQALEKLQEQVSSPSDYVLLGAEG